MLLRKKEFLMYMTDLIVFTQYIVYARKICSSAVLYSKITNFNPKFYYNSFTLFYHDS